MKRRGLVLIAVVMVASLAGCGGGTDFFGPPTGVPPPTDPVQPSFTIEDPNQSTSGNTWRCSGVLRNVSSETQNVEALTFILWGDTFVGQTTIPIVISLAPGQGVRFAVAVNTQGRPFDDIEYRVTTDKVKW